MPAPAAAAVTEVPPVGLLFAAFLGINPVASLLSTAGVLQHLPEATVATLTGRTYLPQVLSSPLHDGLTVVLPTAAALAVLGAVISLFRGGIYIHGEQ